MKKIFFALCIMLIIGSCKTAPAANPDEVSLNTAIRQAAARMETRLDAGTKIALINFTSPSQAFSDYVLDELSAVLVNNRHLVVVDRANLDRIRQELGFNVSGEVSDQSMQEIGQMLGAQALVTGSLTSIADLRRLMFKVIMTETAAVAVQHNADIINDRRVQALLAQGGGSLGVAYGNANYGNTSRSGTSENTATQTTTRQTGAQNGTYTFYPRKRAMQSGVPRDLYIPQIIVSNDYIVIYFATRPQGEYGIPAIYNTNSLGDYSVQDLDNPSRFYSAVNAVYGGGQATVASVSFRRFPATRFKFTIGHPNSELYVFEEIILGEPDQ
jgi:TolB-like protein